jgi:HAD superfamily hydrolase (TIGR01509 family)
VKKTIKTIIWDFDGTLADSEPSYARSDTDFLKSYGIDLGLDDHNQFTGMGSLNFIRYLKKEYGLEKDENILLAEKDQYYMKEIAGGVRAFPTSLTLLDFFGRQNLVQNIASGSTREVIENILASWKLSSRFSHITCPDEVEQGKPAPDLFLRSAELAHTAPEECLVLEDSRFGLEAAVKAGMDCILFPAVGFPAEEAVYRSEGTPDSEDPAQLIAWLTEHYTFQP